MRTVCYHCPLPDDLVGETIDFSSISHKLCEKHKHRILADTADTLEAVKKPEPPKSIMPLSVPATR